MEKDLLNSSIEDFYIPRPKSIVQKPIQSTPTNIPISECKFMLESFEKICHCKDFIDEKTHLECRTVFDEIKSTCLENKN